MWDLQLGILGSFNCHGHLCEEKKIPLEIPANKNCSCSVPALVIFVPIAKNRESDSKGHLVRSKVSRRTPAILKT